MKYRLKALGWHFGASAGLFLLIAGAFYLGWYRWPGWYLAGTLKILPVTLGVFVAAGPLLTFIVANPAKPAAEFARDLAVIGAVQLLAIGYSSLILWQGRPLYYAYSGRELSVVQATEMEPDEVALGQQKNPGFAPYWYSRPRWIYAPNRPGGSLGDTSSMPRYFQPWTNGLRDLGGKLQKVDEWKYFSLAQKNVLKRHLAEQGYGEDYAATMPMTGRGIPLLAVFDPKTLRLKALLFANP